MVFQIRSILREPGLLLKLASSREAVQFGLFVGSFVLVFRGILCLLRRCVGEERRKLVPLVAGAVAGLLSCLLLDRSTRQGVALFLLARAIDITYLNLVQKGYLPEWKYFYVAVYSVAFALPGHAYANEPGCIPPDVYKFYLNFADESLGDLQMRQVWTERMNDRLALQGIARQEPLQYLPKLKRYYESLKGKP